MVEERQGAIIQGLDLIDIIGLVSKKKNKFVALTLQEVEELGLDEKEYLHVRKAVLDGMGDYTRSIMRALFGDIEDIVPFDGRPNK